MNPHNEDPEDPTDQEPYPSEDQFTSAELPDDGPAGAGDPDGAYYYVDYDEAE